MQGVLVRSCCLVLITGITLLTSARKSAGWMLTHCSGGGQKMTGSLESGFSVVFVSLLGFIFFKKFLN